MCRLFGMLATQPSSPERWLVTSDRSLLAQSNVSPELAQADGWGVGWYDSRGQVVVARGVGGAHEAAESPVFVATALRAESPVVLGHLRDASNPMNLPHAQLLGLGNSQPFQHDRTLFVHNGMIPLPRETRSLLGPYESKLQGVNDSEVLFWLLQRNLERSPNPPVAFSRTVEQLSGVWEHSGSPGAGPYTGLNVILAPGPAELWAFCLYLGDHGPSFFDAQRPYYELAYLADPRQVVVGSEPFDSRRSAWHSIPNGTFLHARATPELLTVETGPIPAVLELPAA